MNIAQSWNLIGVLAAFGITIVGLMAQLMTAKIDQVLTRTATSRPLRIGSFATTGRNRGTTSSRV